MNIESVTKSGVTILAPSGRIDSSTAGEFQSVVEEALDQNNKLILDFQEVPYISSAGLRVVLIGAKSTKASGGEFRLCHLCENVQEVFELSGFASILQLESSRDSAIKSILDA